MDIISLIIAIFAILIAIAAIIVALVNMGKTGPTGATGPTGTSSTVPGPTGATGPTGPPNINAVSMFRFNNGVNGNIDISKYSPTNPYNTSSLAGEYMYLTGFPTITTPSIITIQSDPNLLPGESFFINTGELSIFVSGTIGITSNYYLITNYPTNSNISLEFGRIYMFTLLPNGKTLNVSHWASLFSTTSQMGGEAPSTILNNYTNPINNVKISNDHQLNSKESNNSVNISNIPDVPVCQSGCNPQLPTYRRGFGRPQSKLSVYNKPSRY